MGTATCGARQRIVSVGKATVFVTALLLGPFTCPQAVAESAESNQIATPPTTATTPARPRRPAKSVVEPTGAKAPEAPRQANKAPEAPRQVKMLDPAKVDPMELDPTQIDPKKLDARSPNAWIALGL